MANYRNRQQKASGRRRRVERARGQSRQHRQYERGEARRRGIEAREIVQESLENLLLRNATQFVQEGLESERDEYVAEHLQDDATDRDVLYRNGYHRPRAIHTGIGPVDVSVPRLRGAYHSMLVPPYQRRTEVTDETLRQAYLHGLAMRDFDRCFTALFGDAAPLSPSVILRLKKKWHQELQAWSKRMLDERYLYVWVDGVYPKAGPCDERMVVLTVVGLREDGHKELLALREGYRESAESWRDVFRDLKRRGVKFIGAVIGDGIGGLWNAVGEVFPNAVEQRCWQHKIRNVLNAAPDSVHDEMHAALQEMMEARSIGEAHSLRATFQARYSKRFPKAVQSLYEAGDRLWGYLAFPRAHWKSIRTTNPIESMFDTVKLRTNAARRIPRTDSAMALVFKLLIAHIARTRKINQYRLVKKVLDQLHPLTESQAKRVR